MSISGSDRTPGSMLEVYMHALASRTNDDFLDEINLGIGNYNDDEFWQQVESFRRGLFADSGMTHRLMKRAVLQTKMQMVDAVFEGRNDDRILRGVEMPDEGGMTKRQYLDDHMGKVWRNLGYETDDGTEYTREEHQAWLVNEVTGIGFNWVPPHWRMLKMRHEASRSKEAHLIDNLFGRPPEPSPQDMRPMEDFE